MRPIRNSAKGRHRIGQKLRRVGLAAVAVGCLAGGVVGAVASAAPAMASAAATAHKVPSGIYPGESGVTVLCSSPTGFTCAGAGYNGTSSQIGGNGWTYTQYWSYGSAGPSGTKHNCTTYAAYRLQQNGYAYPGWTGNARDWAKDAQSHEVTVDQTPVVGSIAQWNGNHVAYVEAVTASYIITTSDSYGNDLKGHPLGTDRLQIDRNSPYMPDNFIHFKDGPAAQTAPGPYHTGRRVTVEPNATTGVSGHTGPGNTYASNKATGANQPLWIVCYVIGQSITNSSVEDTTKIWDLSDNGYYYTDAWLATGSSEAVVPACHSKTVKIDSHATGGVSGHTGPGNNYAAGPVHKVNTAITIACYVTGQSIKGPYNTTNIWDLAVGGHYYTDAWLYTGTNGPAVPHC
jgi:surface antigen